MEMDELKKIREHIILKYNNELKEKELSDGKELFDEELRYIKKELDKVDELIDIYNNPDIDYRVMRLEILYMQLVSDMSKEDFSKLTVDEEFDIFNANFPNNWSYAFSIEKKLEYLEEAVCSNKSLNQICSNLNKKIKNGNL